MKSRFFIILLLTILFVPILASCGTQDKRLNVAEAETIALTHAGLTADKVTGLHTEYDIDDLVPMYEVQFYYDHWEYDYDIHAETGEILSFDKDN